jgi:hypothetical protein
MWCSRGRGWLCNAGGCDVGGFLNVLLWWVYFVMLRPESRGTHDHIWLSQIRDSPNLKGQVPVFISLRNRVARLYPQALGSRFAPFRQAPIVFKVTPGHGPRGKHSPSIAVKAFTAPLHSNGRGAHNTENIFLLLLYACMFRALHSNGRCWQSRCLAKVYTSQYEDQ